MPNATFGERGEAKSVFSVRRIYADLPQIPGGAESRVPDDQRGSHKRAEDRGHPKEPDVEGANPEVEQVPEDVQGAVLGPDPVEHGQEALPLDPLRLLGRAPEVHVAEKPEAGSGIGKMWGEGSGRHGRPYLTLDPPLPAPSPSGSHLSSTESCPTVAPSEGESRKTFGRGVPCSTVKDQTPDMQAPLVVPEYGMTVQWYCSPSSTPE